MNRQLRILLILCATVIGLGLFPAECPAQTWRAVQDTNGCTWARMKFVNATATNSNWAVSNCRPAVSSAETSAVTSQELNWDGVVNAGETRYVWVYGVSISTVNIANADGGPSAYVGEQTLTTDGDGEFVITIAADGTVTTAVEPASYTAPSHTGDFNPNE